MNDSKQVVMTENGLGVYDMEELTEMVIIKDNTKPNEEPKKPQEDK